MTKRFKVIAVAFCLMFVAAAIAPIARGQNGDMKTVVTFNEPIEIPGGTILPAGTYFFKLLNQDSGRWVVQIFDENQTKTFATLITIEDFRYHPTNKLVMTFTERPAGSPPALKEWFFEGEKFGREFVYPKSRAVELAKLNNEPVLAMPVELVPNITAPVAAATDAPVVALKEAPVVAVTPKGEEIPVAEVVAPAPATDTAPALASLPLPHTASSMPLIGLVGLLSIGAAFGMAVLAKRLS